MYSIVLFQVTLTFVFCYLSSIGSFGNVTNDIIPIIIANFCLLGSLAIFFITNISQVFPYNYLLLLIFTVSESLMIAGWTADMKTDTIILCCGMFMVTTGLLTIHIFQLNKTQENGNLFYTLSASIIVEIIFAYFFLRLTFWTTFAAGCSVFGYGVFIIINTNKISTELPLNEYILGSLLLYVDLLTFFIYLLRTFGKKKR